MIYILTTDPTPKADLSTTHILNEDLLSSSSGTNYKKFIKIKIKWLSNNNRKLAILCLQQQFMHCCFLKMR